MRAGAAPAERPVLDRLRALADLRHRDPAAVHDEAEGLLDDLATDDPARAMGLWVLGLAAHELGRPADAVGHFEGAVTAAHEHDDAHTEALARASMAISLLATGHAGQADDEIGRARALAPPSARGLVDLLAALVLQRTGRLDEAFAAYAESASWLRRESDMANLARLLLNRGTLRAYQGAFVDALTDLREAERLATELELWLLVAMAAHNLGFTEGRRGDVPAALAAFDRAEAAYAAHGAPPRLVGGLAADRCEVFLSVGLSLDAVAGATRALAVLGDDGDATHRSEALLILARAHLAAGDLDAAGAAAAEAAAAFRASRREPWAALADYLAMQAEILTLQDSAAAPPEATLERATHISRLLDEQGWPVEALHVRTFLARVALALGRPEVARRELADVGRARAGASAQLRVETWHATALVRLADGDQAAAKRALRRGLNVVDEHRAVLGATELRVASAAHGAELARLGLRLALADGRPWEVLRWAERWRAGALRLPPVTPPEDPDLEAALQDLRDARATQREATLAGRPDPLLDQRIARLETTVRSRTMHGRGEPATAPVRLDQRTLRAALGAATLVELVSVEGRLLAVTVADGRARLHELIPVAHAAHEQAYLRAALRRLLATPPGAPGIASLRDAVVATAARLDELLLTPLGIPEGPVVVVPTGSLHGLSWGALPSLAGRPVTVAPSAALWQREGRATATETAGHTALIAGPDLPGGTAEVARLRRGYDGATVLHGRRATTTRVQAALEGAGLVHLAAHGRFRADSPLFSSLRLADGLLTVYDLERLRSVPATLVLPACEAAVVDVQAGDELVGTATAMVGLGVTSVVAPLLPVPDDATTPLMLALHDGLRAGLGPSAALAHAAAAGQGDPHQAAVAAAFVCIGAREQLTR
jgi:tetratricopeptide (TPR) repeat protein